MAYKILTINPGSTSTKVGVFDDDNLTMKFSLSHPVEELSRYAHVNEQKDFRKEIILSVLREKGIKLEELSAVVGRGGVIKPIPGGTYRINEAMLADLQSMKYGEHASNLGALIAQDIATTLNIPAFIVDPVVVDELEELARYSGLPEISRKSIFHALNQKAVARQAAEKMGKKYEECNFLVIHLGGGISIGAHQKGRVIDVNNALNGEGPFSPERSGGLPVWDLVQLALSGKYSLMEMKKRITGQGGVVAYLGTQDMLDVEKRAEKGDKEALMVFQAMAYQVAKEAGAMATVLKGKVDSVVITGGLARSELFVKWIEERVSFIAPVFVCPGEDELRALAQGAFRVLKGEEEARKYS